ncbi:MAG: deoxyribodipyrimidine photolyase [Thermoguttaceae bacterium]|nr:deoxyribodipyrimidine photolyase [Thermoguttaceae bacterium]MDW8077897.1 deoxyribodipyrimidine photolyase [Thermoguttaceae bacterium]
MKLDEGLVVGGCPPERILWTNGQKPRPDGACVVYWMTAFRRLGWNFALDRAVAWAEKTHKPLLIVETWSPCFPWSSERQWAFVAQGMKEKIGLTRHGLARYYPVVETKSGELIRIFRRVGTQAVCVVTDFYPLRAWRKQLTEVAAAVPVLVEAVDSNGLVPLAVCDRIFARAFDFRRFWQKNFRRFYAVQPSESPLKRLSAGGELPREMAALLSPVVARTKEFLEDRRLWTKLPFACDVPPVDMPGGTAPARDRLERFILKHLATYARDRNHPDLQATSGLSPYLHHGFISAQEVFAAVTAVERWTADRPTRPASGQVGFFGMGEGAEVFLDQLLTWREIGFNFAFLSDTYDRFDSLPGWAQETLKEHAGDPRPYLYTKEALEAAATVDPLWNAAQNELRTTGILHNYMRMLWGKKILEWTADPQEALERMIDLNNTFGLDAEDPNSYSGIFWILGRYDRPWGPERPIFGNVRYMSTDAAARKLKVKSYVARYSAQPAPLLFDQDPPLSS